MYCIITLVWLDSSLSVDATVLLHGKKHGGTMILWKGNIKHKVTPVPAVSKRLCCLEINLSETVDVLLFCVYMSCDKRQPSDNLVVYQDSLSEIAFIGEARDSSYIFIAGDLNTDFSRNTPQTWELYQFCINECIVPLCKHNVSTVKYTYESVYNGTRSHIDHKPVTSNLVQFIVKYDVLDDINNSFDHLPVIDEFSVSCEYLCTSKPAPRPKVVWYKANLGDINKYKACIDTHLDGVLGNHNNSAVECRNLNCKDKEHKFQFEQLHNELITACLQSEWTTLPSSRGSAFVNPGQHVKHQPVPGYNEFVMNQRERAMLWYWLWKDMRKTRNGYYAEMRKRTQAQFLYAVKMVKRNESIVRSTRMAEAIAQG